MKDTITLPFGDIKKVRELFEKEKDIACIILEPIPANMGLIETEKEYLEELRKITEKENVLLIFDEVISGFRVALGGAQQLYGITPDLTVLGKIIGGGYPVGGFGGCEDIMNLISPLGNVYHAGTLSGNPVSVAAGIKTISILKDNPDMYTKLNEKVAQFVKKLEKLVEKYNISATVNSAGSLFTIFFSDKKVKNLDDAINTSDEMYNIYFDTMTENGIMVPPSKYEAHFISIIHSEEEMQKILEITEKAFQKMRK